MRARSDHGLLEASRSTRHQTDRPVLVVTAAAAEVRAPLQHRDDALEGPAPIRCVPGGQASLLVAGCGATGDGPLATALAVMSPRVVLNIGFAGALDTSLAPGDIVIGTRWHLASVDTPVAAVNPAEMLQEIRGHLDQAGAPCHDAEGYTVESPLHDAIARDRARARTGARFVDMESARWARLALEAGARFATVRVITDRADLRLPEPRHRLLTGSGSVRWWRWLGAARRQSGWRGLPEQLRALRQARRDWMDACHGLDLVTAAVLDSLARTPRSGATSLAGAQPVVEGDGSAR